MRILHLKSDIEYQFDPISNNVRWLLSWIANQWPLFDAPKRMININSNRKSIFFREINRRILDCKALQQLCVYRKKNNNDSSLQAEYDVKVID